VLVDVSADLEIAAAKIIEGKSFDYGTLCSFEQTVVAERSIRDKLIGFQMRKSFFADATQSAALERSLLTKNFAINPGCVGQSPQKIAKMAEFEIPADAVLLRTAGPHVRHLFDRRRAFANTRCACRRTK
jgi:acetaldehyde dehydrogenase (acetylating)